MHHRADKHRAHDMQRHVTALAAIAAFTLGGLLSAWALLPGKAPRGIAAIHPSWKEAAWPFPMDQWGRGTAFHCGASDCGRDITLYLRAKVGFCNCAKGMTDDSELDRVSDFDLIGGTLYPQATGRPITVAWMRGRSRPFAINSGTMLSIGLHDHCDALVATAIVPRGQLADAELQVMEFLGSKTIVAWAETALGL